MKSEQNNFKEDILLKKSTKFFNSKEGWFALLGFGVGCLFGAMPMLFIIAGIALVIYLIVKYKGDGKNGTNKKS